MRNNVLVARGDAISAFGAVVLVAEVSERREMPFKPSKPPSPCFYAPQDPLNASNWKLCTEAHE